jgi:hypothetical protein
MDETGGLVVYQAALPPGAIQRGPLRWPPRAAATWRFQSTLQIGSGIQVTTPLAGKTFPSDQPLTVNWTGGDLNSRVTFRLLVHEGTCDYSFVLQAHASDDTITLGTYTSPGKTGHPSLLGPHGVNPEELILEVTPNLPPRNLFRAGLIAGRRAYLEVHPSFEGVTIL